MSEAFAWDLTGLKPEDAVEKAMASHAMQSKSARNSPCPTPLGGAIELDPTPPGEPQMATLAVSLMMGIKAGCMRPRNGNYWMWNHGSRLLYQFGFVICFGVSLATIRWPEWYNWDHMDWFAYTAWSIVAITELIFIVIRIVGRIDYVGKPGRYEATGINEWFGTLVTLESFGAQWQFVTVTTLNVIGSVLFLYGLLIVHMQMMLDPYNPDAVHTVFPAYRDTWTVLWTVAYSFVQLGLITAALVDPSRLGEREKLHSWSIELSAWRVILLGLVMPVIASGFAIYANVCCEGDWVLY